MIKRYSIVFKSIRFLAILFLAVFSSISYAEGGKLSVKILDIDSPFSPQFDEEQEDEGEYSKFVTYNFHNAISRVHPPVLVDYDNQKSLLLFAPEKEEDKEGGALIYNFNLGNLKMNEVGWLHHSNGGIISIFSYTSNNSDEAWVFVMQKHEESSGVTEYYTWRFSVSKREGGLYIQSFKTNRIGIDGVTTCIDGGTDHFGHKQVCKYKDAASIKKYFDNISKQNN